MEEQAEIKPLQNLLKLYVDERNGVKNKLLTFKVADMLEAGKVYVSISAKVDKIRAAYFQNAFMGNHSTRITSDMADKLNFMHKELRICNRKN